MILVILDLLKYINKVPSKSIKVLSYAKEKKSNEGVGEVYHYKCIFMSITLSIPINQCSIFVRPSMRMRSQMLTHLLGVSRFLCLFFIKAVTVVPMTKFFT